jgi:hypothetical protein
MREREREKGVQKLMPFKDPGMLYEAPFMLYEAPFFTFKEGAKSKP